MNHISSKARVFWPLILVVTLADCTTKDLAIDHLSPAYAPREVLGSLLRLTLGYNPGIAFGIDLGPYLGEWARRLYVIAAIGILAFLANLYRRAMPSARLLAGALALAAGGAIGNVLDRFRERPGVVDFIDVGVGQHRFWTFNVADIAIAMGTAILAVLLWREGRESADVTAADG